MAKFSSISLVQFLCATGAFAALTVDVDDAASVKKAAAVVAEDLMSFYTGEIPGLLPGPPPDGDYYPWAGGALWTTMLEYRRRTGDTQYDDKISEGLLFQRGPNNDFLPPNWTNTAGNDDQAVWGMAALLAAETDFTEPEAEGVKWLELVQNVFDEQSSDSRRVKNGSCAGGLRWQILPFNNGYNYIATVASVAYANLGARLSLQDDKNKTQADSVEDTFDWLQKSKLIDGKFNVYDGTQAEECDSINKVQFSMAAGLAIESAAVMYNATSGDEKWKNLLDGLLERSLDVFFPDGVATDPACEPEKCNTDMTFFKSFLHRSLASTAEVAPYTASSIRPVLKSSAKAAAASCTGGDSGRLCGYVWSDKGDVQTGAGSQMSALSALLSLLPSEKAGSSSSGSGSGTGSDSGSDSGSNGGDSDNATSDGSDTPKNSGTRASASALVVLAGLFASGFALLN